MGIGKRIKQRREYLGISQEELAKKIGYNSRSTVNKIEKEINDITQSKIIAFAKALDTTPAWLMGWEDNSVGKTIKQLRKEKNISLMEMAEELHISVDTLVEYEDGIREIPTYLLNVFANYFNTTVDNLVSYTFEKSNTAFVTENKSLPENYSKWEKEIGYNVHFTPEEVDKIIDFAKFLISQRKDE